MVTFGLLSDMGYCSTVQFSLNKDLQCLNRDWNGKDYTSLFRKHVTRVSIKELLTVDNAAITTKRKLNHFPDSKLSSKSPLSKEAMSKIVARLTEDKRRYSEPIQVTVKFRSRQDSDYVFVREFVRGTVTRYSDDTYARAQSGISKLGSIGKPCETCEKQLSQRIFPMCYRNMETWNLYNSNQRKKNQWRVNRWWCTCSVYRIHN